MKNYLKKLIEFIKTDIGFYLILSLNLLFTFLVMFLFPDQIGTFSKELTTRIRDFFLPFLLSFIGIEISIHKKLSFIFFTVKGVIVQIFGISLTIICMVVAVMNFLSL